MTLLMFSHHADHVVLLTDTPATEMDGTPVQFQCKFYFMPQLRMILAGTGISQLAVAWHEYLHTSILAIDAEMLHNHAPSGLRSAWASLETRFGPMPGTSTIYHFGITEAGRAIRYVYRSADDFVGERHTEPGFGVKPGPADVSGPAPETVDEMIAAAVTIRAEQDALVGHDRLYIGGELILGWISADGSGARVVHRFDDYEEMWLLMNSRVPPSPDSIRG